MEFPPTGQQVPAAMGAGGNPHAHQFYYQQGLQVPGTLSLAEVAVGTAHYIRSISAHTFPPTRGLG